MPARIFDTEMTVKPIKTYSHMAQVVECNTTLGRDILNDCNEPHAKGVESMFYFISRSVIDFGKSTREGHTITEILLTAGKRGYKIKNPSTEVPAITVTDTNPSIDTAFDKVLPVVLLADSPENAAAIMALKQDKYVCIYENTEKGADGSQAFPVIGWENGATGRDLTLDKHSDTGGGWTGNITETGAPTSQLFFFKTDYSTTKAALESLCSEQD